MVRVCSCCDVMVRVCTCCDVMVRVCTCCDVMVRVCTCCDVMVRVCTCCDVMVRACACCDVMVRVCTCCDVMVRVCTCCDNLAPPPVQVHVWIWRTSRTTLPSTLQLAMATPPSPRPWPATGPTSCGGGRGACSPYTWPVSAATPTVWRRSSLSVCGRVGVATESGRGKSWAGHIEVLVHVVFCV